MENFDPTTWAKENKKDFAQNFVKKSHLTDDDKYSAFIMAGLPGSGKTEFSKEIVKTYGIHTLRIDMDEIASQIPTYQPENADQFRKGATVLMNNIFDLVLKNRFNFILDGTFGSPHAISNIERALRRNYTIKIMYVHQDPKLAWKYTLAREKIEHRAIEQQGFISTYFKIIHNLQALQFIGSPHLTLDIALKNPDNSIQKPRLRNVSPNQLDKLINRQYNEDSLKEYIDG